MVNGVTAPRREESGEGMKSSLLLECWATGMLTNAETA